MVQGYGVLWQRITSSGTIRHKTVCIEKWKSPRDSAITFTLRTIILSTFRPHTRLLFNGLKVLPINQLNYPQVACFKYQCANGMLPHSFCSTYQINATYQSYNTRTHNAYHYIYCRLNLHKNTVRTDGLRLWNSQDNKLCCVVSLLGCKDKNIENLLQPL
jgi:hypothetical protein